MRSRRYLANASSRMQFLGSTVRRQPPEIDRFRVTDERCGPRHHSTYIWFLRGLSLYLWLRCRSLYHVVTTFINFPIRGHSLNAMTGLVISPYFPSCSHPRCVRSLADFAKLSPAIPDPDPRLDFQLLGLIAATRERRDERRGRKRTAAGEKKNAHAARWMLCPPEIEATHGRRHVSRNKFSGYRIYFRCGSATEAAFASHSGDC